MSWDAAIVGGGLAGAAAACHLARAGRRVVLLERERGAHHKVCGEFVSVEAAEHLETLADGEGACPPLAALGAVPIEGVRLVSGRAEAAAALPFPAWGLSRLRLDAWALALAERRGAVVRRGVAARALTLDGDGARVETVDGAVTAGAALLATGKHEMRGHGRPGRRSNLIGLKTHLRLSAAQDRALGRHVELALFDGGYAGLQRVESGLANLCLVVARERFAALGRDWRRLAVSVPHLTRRLDGSTALWPRPLAVYNMPYGYLHRDEGGGAVYRLGDQVAVIPSFTGDGMAIALHSARLAADAILAGCGPASFHGEARRAFGPPVRVASLLAALSVPPSLQALLTGVCRAMPGLVAGMAVRTRVRRRAP